MRIIVSAKSAFGVLNAEDNKWYNPADKGALKDVRVGQAYDVVISDVKGTDGKVRKQITQMALVDLNKGAVAVAEKPAEVKANVQENTEVKKTYPAKQFTSKRAFAPKPAEEKVDWAAKDRSQLVGGRSHDAVALVAASLQSCTPMPKVLELYREALVGILKMADEVK